MLPTGFEPAIPASEWQQTQTLDRAANGLCIRLINELSGAKDTCQSVFERGLYTIK